MKSNYTVVRGKVTLEAEVDGKVHILTGDVENVAIKAISEEEYFSSWSIDMPRRLPAGKVEYSMDFVADDDGKFFTIRAFDKPMVVSHNVSVTIEPTTAEIENARIRIGAPSTAHVSIDDLPVVSTPHVYTINTTTKSVTRKKVTFSWNETK